MIWNWRPSRRVASRATGSSAFERHVSFADNDRIQPLRPVSAIEADFKQLLGQQFPVSSAREHFEVLWDEANAAAVRLLGSDASHDYVGLLKRMHEEFESFYSIAVLNGNRTRPGQK